MDTPAYMTLTAEQKAQGYKIYRFLDQIVTLNKQREAVRRAFFPSRNAAKRMNGHFKKLPVIWGNPKNAENCLNEMVPDTTSQKETKEQARLEARISDYNRTVAHLSEKQAGGYTKPGSLSK